MFDPENVSNLLDQINWTTIFRLEQTLFCCSALLLKVYLISALVLVMSRYFLLQETILHK